jgi:hypothetical protein
MMYGFAWRARLGADPERLRAEQRDAQPMSPVKRVYQLLVLCGGDGLLTVNVIAARLGIENGLVKYVLRSLYDDGKAEPDPNLVLVLSAAHKRACETQPGVTPRGEAAALCVGLRFLAEAHAAETRSNAIKGLIDGIVSQPRTPLDLEALQRAMEP